VAEVETKASAYLHTLKELDGGRLEPRAWTENEVRDEFMQACRDNAHYWATTPNGGTVKERCEGVAFSMLVMFDGCKGMLPAYKITVDPAPEDKEYCIEQGINWYEPGTEISNGYLHELFYRGVSD
jgi:hypothetical protein